MSRPIITSELIERFANYYANNRAWGSLHIVLDDDNLADSNVEFCVGWAAKEGDIEGEFLARILLCYTKSQRSRIGRRAQAAFDRRVTQ